MQHSGRGNNQQQHHTINQNDLINYDIYFWKALLFPCKYHKEKEWRKAAFAMLQYKTLYIWSEPYKVCYKNPFFTESNGNYLYEASVKKIELIKISLTPLCYLSLFCQFCWLLFFFFFDIWLISQVGLVTKDQLSGTLNPLLSFSG